MDLQTLAGQLAQSAAYAPEQRIAASLMELLRDDSIPDQQRLQHVAGELRAHGMAILSLPWGRQLAGDVARYIATSLGGVSAVDLVASMVSFGFGASACSPALQCRLWVPQWLFNEAIQRTGDRCEPLGVRWAIPAAWPVPTCQVLVGGFGHEEVLEEAYGLLDLRPAAPAEKNQYPDAWLYRPDDQVDLTHRPDFLAFAVLDPTRAMRAFLVGMGNPLTAIAQELAMLAIAEAAHRADRGMRWNGVFQGTGTQLINYQGKVMLTAGWFLLAIGQLGFECRGISIEDAAAVEIGIIERFGGAIAEAPQGKFCILPEVASRVIFNLDIDWTGIYAP